MFALLYVGKLGALFKLAERTVFSFVIKLREWLGRRMCPFPFDGSAYGFFTRQKLAIAKLFAYTLRRRHHMLGGVAGPQQVLRRAVMRQDHELTLPAGSSSDLAGPIQFAEKFCLADVVDAPGSLRGGCGQCNGRAYIFNVTARRAQWRNVIRKDDLFSAIVDALQYQMEAVHRIAGAINHGQPQDRARQFGIAKDGLLHRNLVILVVNPWI